MTLEILTSDLLAPLRHGFFTRRGGASSGVFSGLNCGVGSCEQSGVVTINGSRVVVPSASIVVEDLGGRIGLNGGQANVDLTATVGGGSSKAPMMGRPPRPRDSGWVSDMPYCAALRPALSTAKAGSRSGASKSAPCRFDFAAMACFLLEGRDVDIRHVITAVRTQCLAALEAAAYRPAASPGRGPSADCRAFSSTDTALRRRP